MKTFYSTETQTFRNAYAMCLLKKDVCFKNQQNIFVSANLNETARCTSSFLILKTNFTATNECQHHSAFRRFDDLFCGKNCKCNWDKFSTLTDIMTFQMYLLLILFILFILTDYAEAQPKYTRPPKHGGGKGNYTTPPERMCIVNASKLLCILYIH